MKDGDGSDDLLTQAEVARWLRVTTKTIQRLRDAGELAFIPGRPVKISRAEVERYLKRKTVRRLKPAPLPVPLVMKSRKDLTARERGRRIAAEVRARGHDPLRRTPQKPKDSR